MSPPNIWGQLNFLYRSLIITFDISENVIYSHLTICGCYAHGWYTTVQIGTIQSALMSTPKRPSAVHGAVPQYSESGHPNVFDKFNVVVALS